MDWMKIASAVALGLMLLFLAPRAKEILANTPKGSAGDWQAAILPLLIVIGLVAFLMSLA